MPISPNARYMEKQMAVTNGRPPSYVHRPSVSGPHGAAAELDVAFVGEDGRWRHLQRDVAAALAGWTRVSDLVGLQVSHRARLLLNI